MLNLLKLLFQYILPKVWITQLAGWFANKKAGWFTKVAIVLFIKYYKIDINEAKIPYVSNYLTFNDFFSRQLRDEIRPINTDPNVLIIPADGTISQLGKIKDNKLFKIKGYFSKLDDLLGGDKLVSDQFRNGTFIMIYLSPKDCHRVYMPCDGILRQMIYIPGKLFSVNQQTAKNIVNLFSRNERVICLFDTAFGLMSQILVGATIVGSIETVWSGTVTPPHGNFIKNWTWCNRKTNNSIFLLKGQEMGCFKLGSTVINLFMPNKVNIIKTLKILSKIKIGQPMASKNT